MLPNQKQQVIAQYSSNLQEESKDIASPPVGEPH